MTSVRSSRFLLGLASSLFLALGSCARPVPYASLDTGLEPLRAAFNADAGRTRVVMLVAPT
jgi:hypothetical protein